MDYPFRLRRATKINFRFQIIVPATLGVFMLFTHLTAQTVCVDTILFEGLKRTKPGVVQRELGIRPGDCLPSLALEASLEPARLRILNTSLFNDVCVEMLQPDSGRAIIVVHVIETWYFLPMPVFGFADRNFNVWWNEFDRDLQRINYGFDLHHRNLTGRRDVFKLNAQFGYTNAYGFSYSMPGVNKKQTLGLSVGGSFNRNREIAYLTVDNKPLFLRNPDGWQFSRLSLYAGLSWRPGFFATHSVRLEFRDNRIADSVGQVLNPDFFLRGRTRQQYTSLSYAFVLDRRDWRPYPLSGDKVVIEMSQSGLLPTEDLHLFRLYTEYTRHFRMGHYWSSGLGGRVRTALPRRTPPYFNNQALGYGGNTVRGYEYFVADGMDFAVVKTSLRRQILEKVFRFNKGMPIQQFRVCPLKVFLSAGSDFGYANDPYYEFDNPMVNRVIWGGGLGLDIVAWYDKVARFEWSINDVGLSGFYMSMNMGF